MVRRAAVALSASLLLLLLLQASAVSELGVSCQDCLVVAKMLEHNIIDMEKDKANLDGGAETRSGRRPTVRLSEKAVDEVLDNVCSELELRVGDHADRLSLPCKKLLEGHRADLEGLLFRDGWRTVRQSLCSDWTGACSAHALYDSGEL